MTRTRPVPGADLLDLQSDPLFVAAPELDAWTRATFIEGFGNLMNPDHSHLKFARMGYLWTNVGNGRHGKTILGIAEIPVFRGDRWQKTRQENQMKDWFGCLPDFVITLYAPFAAAADDATFCALVEHELYHCAQKKDAFGGPKFNNLTGLPEFAMRGHDVEEFVGVVARYGAGPAGSDVERLVAAANAKPLIASVDIARACGTCMSS